MSTDLSTASSLAEPLVFDLSFTTVSDLFSRIEQTRGDALLVARVPRQAIAVVDRVGEERGRKLRILYLAHRQLLFLSIPTSPHEDMHTILEDGLSAEIRSMGLQHSWKRTAATRFPAGASEGSLGEADAGGKPIPGRRGKDQWPAIVFEAGYSQPLLSLRAKMAFWFAASSHAVKIVVLVKAFPESENKLIRVEHWQERPMMLRPGATATRRSTMHSPVCLQGISIAWALDVPYDEAGQVAQYDPASFSVTRGPLTLDFACLFLRDPSNPQEHNVVYSDEVLQRCAVEVWQDA